MSRRTYTVLLELEPATGGYTVSVPALPECLTECESVSEAMANAENAIAAHLAALREAGRPIPDDVDGPVVLVVRDTVDGPR